MKKSILLAMLLSFFSHVYSQSIFYDALALHGILGEMKNYSYPSFSKCQANPDLPECKKYFKLISILRAYAPDTISSLNDIDVIKYYKSTNPFFRDLPAAATASANFGKSLSDISAGSIISSIGGLDVTTIADGLARLIVARTKEELNSFFFDRFREEMAKSIELQIFFPETYQMLQTIGVKIYNYNAYLTGLREAFEHDLSKIFVNFTPLLDHEKYVHVFDEFPSLRWIVKSSFYVINQLNNKIHPGEIIHNFPERQGRDAAPPLVFSSIRVADVFSQSLRSSTSKYWIGIDSISLLADPAAFRIYLGLIYQQMTKEKREIPFTINAHTRLFKADILKGIGEKWDSVQTSVHQYQAFIIELGTDLDRINVSLKSINTVAENKDPNYTAVYYFLDASLDLFDDAKKTLKLPGIAELLAANHTNSQSDLAIYEKYLRVGRNANNLYYNINKRDYGTSVSDLWNILNEVFPKDVITRSQAIAKAESDESVNELNKKFAGSKDREQDVYKKALAFIEAKKNSYAGQFIPKVLKYGTFMAAMVTAKTSEEVKIVIESSALPAGSSRIKRESEFNVAVNSYLGIFAGKEWISGISNKHWINNYSLSVPLGVSFSWGDLFRAVEGKPGWSLGGFFSMIDLGAIASFRFGDDSTATIPKIQLKDILAPGLFLSLGFPKTPFSLNIGGQYGPLLREVTATHHSTLDNGYWRFGASLLVDIPLFNIYNKEKD